MAEHSSERIRFLNPAALAPPPGYSNIAEVRRGRVVYFAGQLATDDKGKLVGGNDFGAQAEQVRSPRSAARHAISRS